MTWRRFGVGGFEGAVAVCVRGPGRLLLRGVAAVVAPFLALAAPVVAPFLVLAAAVVAQLLVLAAPVVASELVPVEVPRDAVTVLNEKSFWRWCEVSRKPVVTVAALKAAGLEGARPKPLPGLYVDSPLPPDDWRDPDLDDSAWPRGAGRNFANLIFSKLQLTTACFRGKFACGDLSRTYWKPTLYVSARFRGGIVVYLNGREVARAGMPRGKITLTTPALPYPDDLFLKKNGRPYIFPASYQRHKRIRAGDKDLIRRLRGRDRELKPVKIGVEYLRAGTNVLTVEVHRSDYHASALSWFQNNRSGRWVPCKLLSLRLAVAGKGGHTQRRSPQAETGLAGGRPRPGVDEGGTGLERRP